MPCVTRQLESSVAYVWRAKVAGPGERLRHWRTRTGYYQVITHLLEAQGSSSLGMAEVVGRAGGGRSTVYAVAADGTLAEAYRAGTRPAVRMLADLAGAGPIDRLVAETKVWSFWPLRQAWLRELDELFPAAESPPPVAGWQRPSRGGGRRTPCSPPRRPDCHRSARWRT